MVNVFKRSIVIPHLRVVGLNVEYKEGNRIYVISVLCVAIEVSSNLQCF